MSIRTHRLMAIAGVTCISFSPVLIRAAEDASDLTIAFFRSIYALPFLALLYWRIRGRDQRPTKSRLIAVGSGVFLAIDLTFWHASIREIGAGLAALLVNLQVVFVALIAWAVFGERPGRRSVALLPVILLGVFLISGVAGIETYGDNPRLGSAQSIFSALMYALFILLLRESGRGHSTPATGPVLDATIGTAAVTLMIGLAFDGGFDLVPVWPPHCWIALQAIVAQVIGWSLIARSMPHLPALETSILILGQPMLAILWARLIFDEALGTGQWVGVALVLIGLLAFSLGKGGGLSNKTGQKIGQPIDDPV